MSNDISPASKRIKLNPHHQNDNDNEDSDPLLPGLPNHLAQVCLSLLPPFSLFSVCRSWRRLIYSPSFPPFLSLYALFSTSAPHQSLHFRSFDPISSTWHVLPPPPSDPPLRLLLRHPSFVSRNLPIQSLSVAGNLLILAATAADFSPAIPRPLVFHTRGWRWDFGPPLAAPRRWCAAGSLRGSAYVASGIGSQFSHEVARTVERWDLESESAWERVGDLKDGRFSRDAIDAVGWRGKLCMVNVQGGSMKDGVVYDAEKDAWEEMPAGMIGGWRGPAAAMDEEEMFMVDEAKGVLRRYDEERDEWEKVVESERLRGAEQIAAGGGKVCVVCGGGRGIVVVDVVSPSPGRIWEVETPSGLEAVAVHVLPRMSIPNGLSTRVVRNHFEPDESDELMQELQKFERMIKGSTIMKANFAEASSSKPSLGNGKKKQVAKKENSSVPPNKGKNKKKRNPNKLKCFHCGKVGHMKKNCKDYLAAKGKGGVQANEKSSK